MRHGSLFSGIGGFDLAAEWMGWENVFHCEWNEFGQQVLKYYWPHAESFTDITKSDFTKYENTIDILSGGFPCQPYSTAGKRLGKEDERHLWPEMLRAIREISPRWVVGENVRGLTNWNGGLVFDEVQADLETEGYEVLPFLLPACGVGAPHRRDRIWFIAHSDSNGRGSKNTAGNENQSKREGLQQQYKVELFEKSGNTREFFTNTEHDRRKRERVSDEQWEEDNDAARFGASGNVANASNKGLQRSQKQGSIRSIGQERNEQFAGLFQSAWEEFPTQSPLCNGNDGISTGLDTSTISFSKWRNESIKAGGNAIVPQVAYQIFKAIEQYEKQSA